MVEIDEDRSPRGFVTLSVDVIREIVVIFTGFTLLILQGIGWLLFGLEPSWALVIAGAGLLGYTIPLHADQRRRNGGG